MHRVIQTLARVTALAGGIVLIGLIVLTTLSIIGRSVNKFFHADFFDQTLTGLSQWVIDIGVGEINGSYELLEAGVAFAIFSFLPICQLYGSHATVDVFTSFLSRRSNRWIAAFWEVVLTAVLILIVAQLFGGMERYIRNGQTTLFLQFPVWWSYAASFAAGVVACITAVYCAVLRIVKAVKDQTILPSEAGGH